MLVVVAVGESERSVGPWRAEWWTHKGAQRQAQGAGCAEPPLVVRSEGGFRRRWYLPKLLFWLAFSLEDTLQREVVQ